MGPGVGKGLGFHVWDIQLKNVTKTFVQNDQIGVILFTCSAILVKLSLLILYLRLFNPNRLTRYLIFGGMIACSLFYSITIIISAAFCVPDPSGPNDDRAWLKQSKTCRPAVVKIAFAQGIFGTISDIYLLVIPLQIILRLNLATQRRIGMVAVFGTGIM